MSLADLQGFDQRVFLWINTVATSPRLDWFFSHITDLHKQPWFAATSLIVVMIAAFWKYRARSWRVLLGLVLAVALSDLFCYRVLKTYVDRPRPFQSEVLAGKVIKRGEASGNSFPSNHAANCMAAARILATCFPAGSYIFYAFALLVAYSRIYLGLHYPSDVLAGAAVGLAIGRLVAVFTVIQLKYWSRPDV